MRWWRVAAVAALAVSAGGCVRTISPARTFDAYEHKAKDTAESALSAVQTARLGARVGTDGDAFGPYVSVLFSEAEAGSGEIANTHTPAPDAIGIFGDSVLYVNLDECTSCTACYQPDVCPVGAIYADEHVPDGTANAKYNKADTAKVGWGNILARVGGRRVDPHVAHANASASVEFGVNVDSA